VNPVLHRQWTDALRRNNFQRAWELSDRSLSDYCASGAIKHAGQRHHQRIWRGEDLRDKLVLIRCYHGLGDTIQFIRFAKPLREIARQVIVWGQPELLSLLAQVDGIDRVMPLHDGAPDTKFDVDIEVMELAHALRATPQLTAGRVPYLPRDFCKSKKQVNSPLSIGIVWEAGTWNTRRSAPPPLFARLLENSDVRLFSLQQGPGRASAATIPAEDIAADDLQTLASTITRLDLIVTVDTMVAHLAGALGVPVWTMLHRGCDWRWPETGRETIWYPSMKLFHQKRAGDWTNVMDEMIEELKLFKSAVATLKSGLKEMSV
jgi:hypothetical protein